MLRPGSDDYPDAAPLAYAKTSDGKAGPAWELVRRPDQPDNLVATGSYELSSVDLQRLWEDGKAQVATILGCDRTGFRRLLRQVEDDRTRVDWKIDSNWLTGMVHYTPYLLATEEIKGFLSETHHPDFRLARPQGYTVPARAILAIGAEMQFDMDAIRGIGAVIVLSSDPGVKAKDEMALNLDNQKIEIRLNERLFSRISRLHAHPNLRTMLETTIYFPAVMQSVQQLADIAEEDNRAWVKALRAQLRKLRLPDSGDALKEEAQTIASRVLQQPLAKSLDVFDHFVNFDVE